MSTLAHGVVDGTRQAEASVYAVHFRLLAVAGGCGVGHSFCLHLALPLKLNLLVELLNFFVQ